MRSVGDAFLIFGQWSPGDQELIQTRKEAEVRGLFETDRLGRKRLVSDELDMGIMRFKRSASSVLVFTDAFYPNDYQTSNNNKRNK